MILTFFKLIFSNFDVILIIDDNHKVRFFIIFVMMMMKCIYTIVWVNETNAIILSVLELMETVEIVLKQGHAMAK